MGSAPFAVFVGLGRQGLQRRAVDLLEQLAAGDAEPAQGLALVELDQEFGDGGVDLGQAVEEPVAQPAQQPALDDEHGLLDLGLVARVSRPRRQDGGAVMGRHLGVGAVDLGVVEAGPDDRGLGVVGHEESGTPPIESKARRCASIQSGSVWVQVALAKVKLDAPITATKICAARVSPVRRSTMTGTVSPA